MRWDDDRLRQAAVVGLGRTLLIRLLAGTPWTMLCVNTERPLFWLMARAEFSDVSELRGRRVAMHPALVAPGCFARIILRGRGLDPDADIDAVPMFPGDYSEHVRMLKSGELDAAVIGSTLSPDQLAAEEGLRLLLFFGDELQIPTTGVAVDPSVLALDDPRVKGLVRANLRALGTLLDDPALGAEHVGRLLPAAGDASARDFYDRYVGPHFKADGRPDPEVVAKALALVAESCGSSPGAPWTSRRPRRSTGPTSPRPGRREPLGGGCRGAALQSPGRTSKGSATSATTSPWPT